MSKGLENWNGKDFISESLTTGQALLDDDHQTWDKIIASYLPEASKIIALRGAGSWNGMDKVEIDTLLSTKLIPRIEEQQKNPGLVLVMHDGDYDDPAKPDLGYAAGRLLDRFGNNTDRVVFLVAQKESWHPDDLKGLNLRNIHRLQYVTYLFPDGRYSDDHNSFTQDKTLVNSDKYEQWYIGASGNIASGQLTDYDSKVSFSPRRKAVLFRIGNNPALDQELQMLISQAEDQGNHTRAENLRARVEQRKRIYGTHWNNEGVPDIRVDLYPHLEFEFVT